MAKGCKGGFDCLDKNQNSHERIAQLLLNLQFDAVFQRATRLKPMPAAPLNGRSTGGWPRDRYIKFMKISQRAKSQKRKQIEALERLPDKLQAVTAGSLGASFPFVKWLLPWAGVWLVEGLC